MDLHESSLAIDAYAEFCKQMRIKNSKDALRVMSGLSDKSSVISFVEDTLSPANR